MKHFIVISTGEISNLSQGVNNFFLSIFAGVFFYKVPV